MFEKGKLIDDFMGGKSHLGTMKSFLFLLSNNKIINYMIENLFKRNRYGISCSKMGFVAWFRPF